MVPGAEIRARFAALPVFVLAVPWQCSLVTPQDVASVELAVLGTAPASDAARRALPGEPPRRSPPGDDPAGPPPALDARIAHPPARSLASIERAAAAPPRDLGPAGCITAPPAAGTLARGSGASPRGIGPVECIATAPRRTTDPGERTAGPPRTPIEPSAITAKREAPVERIATAPRAAPLATITLPEEVVIKVMQAGQPFFLRCWDRALRKDPGPPANKVRLRLDVDEHGRVTAAHSDSDSAELAGCLALVGRRLSFPAPGQPAVVELPLMFR